MILSSLTDLLPVSRPMTDFFCEMQKKTFTAMFKMLLPYYVENNI